MEVDPPKLFYFPTSFYSQKVCLALAEKGIPYLSHPVNLGQFENCTPSYLKINPKGQVPVLQDGEKYVIGSNDIMKYLDKVYEGALLFPNINQEKCTHFQSAFDTISIEVLTNGAMVCPHLVEDCKVPENIRLKMIEAFMNGRKSKKLEELKREAEPELGSVYEQKISESQQFEKMMQSDSIEEVVKKELEKVREILIEVNNELKDKKGVLWLCGPDFTIADISLAILLQRLKLIGFAGDLWEDGFLPHVEGYYIRLLMRKTFRTVCVGDASYFYMMRVAFGDYGTFGFILGAFGALIFSTWLGLWMAGKT